MDRCITHRGSPHRVARQALAAATVIAIGAALALAPAAPASAADPGANGRIVFASNVTGSWQLLSMRPNGLHVHVLTHLPDTGFRDLWPDVSPDGTHIVFQSDQGGEDELYTMDADGSDMTQLTEDPAFYDTAPSWSPDGTHLVFARCGDIGCGISEIAADGTGLTDLTPQRGNDFHPEFTPDGSKIVFESQRHALISAVWVMDADGLHAHRLTPSRLRAGGPDVSPDGLHVVFFTNENYAGPASLWVVGIDGSGLRRLTTSRQGHSDLWPRFSPDGRFITFATDRAYRDLCCFEVWRMDADGSAAVPLTSNLTIGGCSDGNCVFPEWGVEPAG
jgi:Tol biopolymer transport system component